MADYKTLYHKLYNRITDVIEDLQQVQQETEALYANDCDAQITVLESNKNAEKTAE